jgi:hypothetical protein
VELRQNIEYSTSGLQIMNTVFQSLIFYTEWARRQREIFSPFNIAEIKIIGILWLFILEISYN